MKYLTETLRLTLWMLAGSLTVLVIVVWSEASRWPEPLPSTPIYCRHTGEWR